MVFFLELSSPVFASVTNGTVDAIYHYAWGENVGFVDFGSTAGNVHITDSSLSGSIYGENIGWIDLSTVTNTSAGVLSGYAWGENVGFIDFSKVAIGTDGVFTGGAYGENIGWITFGTGGNKVATDWRPLSVRPVTHSSGGGYIRPPITIPVVTPPVVPPIPTIPPISPSIPLTILAIPPVISSNTVNTIITNKNLKQKITVSNIKTSPSPIPQTNQPSTQTESTITQTGLNKNSNLPISYFAQISSKIITMASNTYHVVVSSLINTITWIDDRVTSFFIFISSLFYK